MNIVAPSEDRHAVREVVRDVLAAHSSPASVRAIIEAGTGNDPDLDRTFGELGWFGIDVPLESDGGGGTTAQWQQVLEGCGYATAPSRLLGSSAGCIGVLLHAGTDEQRARWLAPLAGGGTAGAVVLPNVFETRPDIGVRATATDGGLRLDGTVPYVVDASTADVLVVLAHVDSDTSVFVVVDVEAGGVSVQRQPTIDQTRNLGRVTFSDTELDADRVLVEGTAADDAVEAVTDRLALAVAADAVGVASRVLDLTTAYVSQRHQFGRAIGSFQAVKHQAADMLVRTEMSRVLLDDAADATDERRVDASILASTAKEFACDTAGWVAGRGVQLHGGIGYTWEHDMHILQKRAKLDEALFGDRRWHRERALRIQSELPAGG